jgi:hypothetical protein
MHDWTLARLDRCSVRIRPRLGRGLRQGALCVIGRRLLNAVAAALVAF